MADHDQARAVVARLVDALPSGGRPVLNDGSRGIGAAHERAQDACNDTGAIPYFLRPVDRIAAFFDGLELLEPGVAPVPFRWPRTSGKSRAPVAS
ncbi:SAM-dependent methyltransferase [Streptomyces nitrosporeus]|uniref:SAM-dependent methyltransferase n=1 Tax=Streptomyces nitrosporeus TaxID=28894 RepID=UPI003D9EE8E7